MKKAISFVLLYSFLLTNVFAARVFAQTVKQTSVGYPTLTKYSTDLTELARNGRLNQNANYEREVNRLVTSLASGDLRQPVVLDETGESQELVVEHLASRIASGDVPAALQGKRVFKLEIDTLFSNSKTGAESSAIVADIVSELGSSKGEIILFVDELTNFVGNTQINDALKNALVQGKVKIIGGSSEIAYNERINGSAEIAALFNPGDNRAPRLVCTELLFELHFPFLVQECCWDVRLAEASELEQIAVAHDEVAFIESGSSPLLKDRRGFLKRCLKRIEQKRTFVVFENGKLVFKADIVAETSDVIYLEGIYVAPEYRGKGVGSNCLSNLGRQLLERVENVCLLSNVEFKTAHRSFVKAGFKNTDCCQTIFV